MECNGHVIAVETVPIGPSSGGTTKNHLPIEVLNSIVRKETAFDACRRALDLLDKKSGQVDPKERVNFVRDTRLILHESKMKSLREVDESWERLSQQEKKTFGGVTGNNPTVCIIGHPKDRHCLGRVQINIERCLVATMANYPLGSASTSVVRTFTPQHYTMDYIDSAAIMICILSKDFLSSGFCMNSLNIGILRNRNEGGYLIPIAIEILDPCSTPSFVRLLPTVDASCWRWHEIEDEDFEEDFVKIQGMIVAAAIMTWSKQWKDRTTLIDACPNDDWDGDSDDDDYMRCTVCTIL